MKHLHAILLLIVLALMACNNDNEATDITDDETGRIQTYLDSMGLDLQQDGNGIYAYEIISTEGKTQLQGNVLSIFYSLSVLGGDIIDIADSLDEDTVVVKQGVNAIYPVGFDHALSYMREGEKWGFIIPSGEGYGSFSFSTLIPENATILAEISLLKIRNEDEVLDEELRQMTDYAADANLSDTVNYPLNQPETLTNGMIIKRLRAGTDSLPSAGQLVTVAYEGRLLDGVVFDRAPRAEVFQFVLNASDVIPGLNAVVSRMKMGERFLAIMPSYLAYRESAQVIPGFLTEEMVSRKIVPAYAEKVGPYKPLIFDIELIGIN